MMKKGVKKPKDIIAVFYTCGLAYLTTVYTIVYSYIVYSIVQIPIKEHNIIYTN